MSVTLIAAVMALVLGHLAPSLAAAVRHYDWYGHWLHWLGRRLPAGGFWHGRWGLVVGLVPPLLVVGVFQQALQTPLFGLAGLIFAIAVLFYAWGPRDLDRDVDAVAVAGDPEARHLAAARLWSDGVAPALDGDALVGAVFQSALRRWFGVLFWFLLLGPLGALLYRLSALSVEGEAARQLSPATLVGARLGLAILDWPVAQLMTLALALVGNFDTVLAAWRESGGASLSLELGFLAAVARANVRGELSEAASDEPLESQVGADGMADMPALRDALSMVWRSLLVWLAVLALLVIAGFVG